MNSREALRRSGKNLQDIRNAKGFSVETLAILSQVDEDAIRAMEAGEFDVLPGIVYELAAALNVDIRQILVDPTAQQVL
ncbi:MAG: hypothetical protein NVSMB24_38730 [Mucilaginibacter sp.]